jgi:hypothetical protein
MKRIVFAALCGFAALPLLAVEASAHGCHRDIQRGAYGWHRHVGPDCDRVASSAPRSYRDEYERRRYRDGRGNYEGRGRYHRPVCEKKCRYIGPFKKCKTVCQD